jgi:hypothetical protein
MKLEAVIVCKDYSDFLEHTLPENIQHLDRVVVVTHPDDKATRALCQKYGVDCVPTTCMHEDGDKFNKGRAINLGLGHFRGLDWFLHLDADIVLPHNFRNLLQRAKLREENLYGCDRMNVYGYEHWMKHRDHKAPSYSHGYFVEPHKAFPVGARIVHHEHGYTPIGYFQLWHKSQGKKYPIHQGNAEHTDVLFACQWARQHRVLLPEVLVYHLDSCDGPTPMGANWNGRKTPIFGPKKHHHEPPKPAHGHGHHHGGHHPHHHGYKPCDWEVRELAKKRS